MPITATDLTQLVTMIWEATLQLPLEPAPSTQDASLAVASMVSITGAWEGSLLLETSQPFASRAASVMFDLGTEEIRPADRQDALGELTNMIGGNVKGLLPEPCALSLPRVPAHTERVERLPQTRVRLDFTSEGESIRVTLTAGVLLAA